MSPEALVEELRKYAFDNGLAGPWLGERIRALLDAYAAARAERDEALDALAAIRKRAKAYKPGRWVDGVFHPQLSDADVRDAKAETDAADAVLAKAGRR